MPLADSDGVKSFIADVYNPESPNYRHFLTPSEFSAKFGPSQEDYSAVVRFAKSYGLSVVGGSFDGRDVQVKGPVSAVEAAFHVTMMNYQDPTENRIFFSPAQEPTVDAGVKLMQVSGLDNYSIPVSQLTRRNPNEIAAAVTGSGPSDSFLGSDMRAAYYGKTLTGAGQNLGLFEYGGTDIADLNNYYQNVGQTRHVPVTLLSTDGTNTGCLAAQGCDDTEETLDMTQAIGMAPNLASLVMYIGSTDTAILSAMTTHSPLPTTIGCSWLWNPADPNTDDVYFQQMIAQGQNFFSAAGDDGNWAKRGYPSYPAEDAYVVSVGGTDLETVSAGGAWKSETAWASTGGGISPDQIAIPAWQQLAGVINSSNKGSTVYRNGPDVSANANYTFYVCADQTACSANEYGGTSFAAPMWAGLIALVNEEKVSQNAPTIGFLNPVIYRTNVTSGYGQLFHDITSGKVGSFSAVTGYDLLTGWGSPQPALVNYLAAH